MKKIVAFLIVSIVSAAHGEGVSAQEVIESLKTPAARAWLDQRLMSEKKKMNEEDYKRSLSHLLEKVLKSDIPGAQKVDAADYLLTKGAYIAILPFLPMGNNKQLMDDFIEEYGLDTIRNSAGNRFWYGFTDKVSIENKTGTNLAFTNNGRPILMALRQLRVTIDTIKSTAESNIDLPKYLNFVEDGKNWLGLAYFSNSAAKIYSQLGIFRFNPTTLQTSSLEFFNMPREVANGNTITFERLYPIAKAGTPEYVLVIATVESRSSQTTDVHFYSLRVGNPEPQLLGTLANRNRKETSKWIDPFEEYYDYTGKQK